METMEAESTNKSGQTETCTGVSINKLLEMAGPAADATTVAFVADDGYTAKVNLAEVQSCADCIVSFRDQGGFSIVMPGIPGGFQIKGLIEIQVKSDTRPDRCPGTCQVYLFDGLPDSRYTLPAPCRRATFERGR